MLYYFICCADLCSTAASVGDSRNIWRTSPFVSKAAGCTCGLSPTNATSMPCLATFGSVLSRWETHRVKLAAARMLPGVLPPINPSCFESRLLRLPPNEGESGRHRCRARHGHFRTGLAGPDSCQHQRLNWQTQDLGSCAVRPSEFQLVRPERPPAACGGRAISASEIVPRGDNSLGVDDGSWRSNDLVLLWFS